MSESFLALSRVHFPVSALGPGRRVGIWFQGCSRRCPGCISPDTWKFARAALSVADCIRSLDHCLRRCDGVTLTGGEPLDQIAALKALARALKKHYSKSIFLFTGHAYAEALPLLSMLSPDIDAAMCGPYEASQPQTLALRGSDNQTLHCFTPLGESEFSSYERRAEARDKRLDAMFDADGSVWFAGIPARGDMKRLNRFLEERARRLENGQ
ncbi:MAG: radical SAM protein [Azoarcus sp.]|jgi:anaerobic ribonucleoside-triphosphate reductase activating protein|nr:radical SAM protein [Azoarcus sp.]